MSRTWSIDAEGFSKYNKISSAKRDIWCYESLIAIGLIFCEFLMKCAKGSSESRNRLGLRGQPCRDERATGNREEHVLPVIIMADGAAYSTLICIIPPPSSPILPINKAILSDQMPS